MIKNIVKISIASSIVLTTVNAKSIEVKNGWQLLGASTDISVSQIDKNKCIEYIWKYNASNKTSPWQLHISNGRLIVNPYEDFDTIKRGEGFWAKINSSTSVCNINITDENNNTETNQSIQIKAPKTTLSQYNEYDYKPNLGEGYKYTISNKPKWATFDTNTGELKGIPTESKVYKNIEINATKGDKTIQVAKFDLTILPAVDIASKYAKAIQGTKSNYYYYQPATNVLDHNISTYNHTSNNPKENWIELEFPVEASIYKIVIQNRQTWGTRLDGATVYITDEKYSDNLKESEKVGTLTSSTKDQVFTFDNPKKGKYIIIKAKDSNILHIASVMVYGSLTQSPLFDSTSYTLGITPQTKVGDIIGQINAVDFQEDTIEYSIKNTDLFAIDKNNGTITLKHDIPNQIQNYTFEIIASDGENKTSVPVKIIPLSCNGVNVKTWENVNQTLSDFIKQNTTSPNSIGILNDIDIKNSDKDFIVQYKAMFKPNISGEYLFGFGADGISHLKIAYDENMTKPIIDISAPALSNPKDWNQNIKSNTVSLKAGLVYYVELFVKESQSKEHHISLGLKETNATDFMKIPSEQLYPITLYTNSCTQTCPMDATLKLETTQPLYAIPGTVYSSTPYEKNNESTYNPKTIDIFVYDKNNIKYIGCNLSLKPSSGWVYDENISTNNINGKASAIWVGGKYSDDDQILKVTADNGDSLNVIGKSVKGKEMRSDSIWMRYKVEPYNEFNITIKPLTNPTTTYYSALNWSGSYAGIQWVNDKETRIIFSTWDVGEQKAQIVDKGKSNKQIGFGGEGTGASVRFYFPPKTFGHIDGLPDDYMLETNHEYMLNMKVTHPEDCNGLDECTDFSMNFYDKTKNLGPIYLGTLRFPQKVTPNWAASFVEDWVGEPNDDCITAKRRSVIYSNISYKSSASNVWKKVTEGSFSSIYKPNNNEICSNYTAFEKDGGFLMSSGGEDKEFLGKPLIWDKTKQIKIKP